MTEELRDMAGAEAHPLADLQLHVEERLPPGRASALQAHLEACGRCRRELEALRRVRTKLRTDLPEVLVPPEVSARVLAALEAEARALGPAGALRPPLSRRAFLVGGGVAAAAALAALLLRRPPSDPVEAAVRDLQRFATNRLSLELETPVPSRLEASLRERGLGFEARVFDFGMMGFGLVGGGVHAVVGRPSALFAYRGSTGLNLVCQMYPGTLSELPAPASSTTINDILFQLYDVEGSTLVFWQEGPVVCVLASDGDRSEALDLAVAKAVLV